MFPTKELALSGPGPDYTLEVLYGEPVSNPITLLDGSIGTKVKILQTFFDGYLTYDRYGKVVDHIHGEFGDAQFFHDTLYPDGAEYHETYIRNIGTTIVSLDADGNRTQTFKQDPQYYDDPQTTVTFTAGRTLTTLWIGSNNSLETTQSFYNNGEQVKSFVNTADDTRRVLSYDAGGAVNHEQRFDALGKLVYDVTGLVSDEHSSMQVRADGVHTTLFYGAKAEFKELEKLDGSFQTFSYAAEQTHGGATGNDVFSGFRGGDDTFVFGGDFANDTIRNFEADRDILKFIDPAVDEADISLTYASYGNDTIVHVAGEGTITLKGAHIASVGGLHFVGEGFGLDLFV